MNSHVTEIDFSFIGVGVSLDVEIIFESYSLIPANCENGVPISQAESAACTITELKIRLEDEWVSAPWLYEIIASQGLVSEIEEELLSYI